MDSVAHGGSDSGRNEQPAREPQIRWEVDDEVEVYNLTAHTQYNGLRAVVRQVANGKCDVKTSDGKMLRLLPTNLRRPSRSLEPEPEILSVGCPVRLNDHLPRFTGMRGRVVAHLAEKDRYLISLLSGKEVLVRRGHFEEASTPSESGSSSQSSESADSEDGSSVSSSPERRKRMAVRPSRRDVRRRRESSRTSISTTHCLPRCTTSTATERERERSRSQTERRNFRLDPETRPHRREWRIGDVVQISGLQETIRGVVVHPLGPNGLIGVTLRSGVTMHVKASTLQPEDCAALTARPVLLCRGETVELLDGAYQGRRAKVLGLDLTNSVYKMQLEGACEVFIPVSARVRLVHDPCGLGQVVWKGSQQGEVTGFSRTQGRYLVRISGEEESLSREDLTVPGESERPPLAKVVRRYPGVRPGLRVELYGLARAAWENGAVGVVQGVENERLTVLTDDGRVARCRAENIRIHITNRYRGLIVTPFAEPVSPYVIVISARTAQDFAEELDALEVEGNLHLCYCLTQDEAELENIYEELACRFEGVRFLIATEDDHRLFAMSFFAASQEIIFSAKGFERRIRFEELPKNEPCDGRYVAIAGGEDPSGTTFATKWFRSHQDRERCTWYFFLHHDSEGEVLLERDMIGETWEAIAERAKAMQCTAFSMDGIGSVSFKNTVQLQSAWVQKWTMRGEHAGIWIRGQGPEITDPPNFRKHKIPKLPRVTVTLTPGVDAMVYGGGAEDGDIVQLLRMTLSGNWLARCIRTNAVAIYSPELLFKVLKPKQKKRRSSKMT